MKARWFRSLLGVSLLTALVLVPLSLGADEQETRSRFGDGIKILINGDGSGVSLDGAGKVGNSLGTVRKELPPEPTAEVPAPPVPPEPRTVLGSRPSPSLPVIINLDGPEAENYVMKRPEAVQQAGLPTIVNLPVQDQGFQGFGGFGTGNHRTGLVGNQANQTGGGAGFHIGHSGGHAAPAANHHAAAQAGRKR